MPCLLKATRLATCAARPATRSDGRPGGSKGVAIWPQCAARPRFPHCCACESAPAAAGGCYMTTVRRNIRAGNGMTATGATVRAQARRARWLNSAESRRSRGRDQTGGFDAIATPGAHQREVPIRAEPIRHASRFVVNYFERQRPRRGGERGHRDMAPRSRSECV